MFECARNLRRSLRNKPLQLLTFFLLLLPSGAWAQQTPTAPPAVAPNPSTGASGVVQQVGLLNFFTSRTPYEFWLTVLVCLTGLSVMGMMVWAITRSATARPEDTTRPLIVVAIIMSALILVIAGFSNEQIAPAFGLFGTIVGYMLGRMSSTPPAAPPVPPAGGPASAAPDPAQPGS